MAYEARREDWDDDELDKEMQRARNDAANQRAIQDAAVVAANSGHPVAAAIGKGVQAVDKVTGGKGSEIVGKGLTKANEHAPLGGAVQGLTNKATESGIADKVTQAYAAKQGEGSKDGAKGGEQKGSPPSNDKKPDANKKTDNKKETKPTESGLPPKDNLPKDELEKAPKDKKDTETEGSGFKPIMILPIIPFLTPFIIILIAVVAITGNSSEYQDAFGVSEEAGESTGGMAVSVSNAEQKEFYQRVVAIKSEFEQEGKTVDALKVVGVYHVLNKKGLVASYASMTDARIRTIANAMFKDNIYSDDTFKENLVKKVFPSYSSSLSEADRNIMAKEVFSYVSNYEDLIGKQDTTACYEGDSCTYDIKGYRLNKTKKAVQNVKVSNLYVRLMQCGKGAGRDYGGTFGQPLAGEELVPFEKYVLGAAYAEMGSNTEQAFKTQLVVARSFTLSRHADVGGWRKLRQEGDKWILQLGNCTLDQLYCDPDKGCSRDSTSSGYHLHTGTSGYAAVYKKALSEDSPYRKYAKETVGEVLVDSNGYIIQTGFLMAENKKFTNLAKSGYNYKQILLNVYSSGNRNYGASSIYKASCGKICSNDSEVSNWKQYEGSWTGVQVGTSGKTIKQIGCLATALAIQVKRSGVPTNIAGEFNPGTFVEYMNSHNGFYGGDLNWSGPTAAAPKFVYQNTIYLNGLDKQQKLDKIKEITSQPGVYAVCEVKGNTGQHWVAVDKVEGGNIKMMDPGSSSTDMWTQYKWANTSRIVYYKVS